MDRPIVEWVDLAYGRIMFLSFEAYVDSSLGKVIVSHRRTLAQSSAD